jgi:hypothetical protein
MRGLNWKTNLPEMPDPDNMFSGRHKILSARRAVELFKVMNVSENIIPAMLLTVAAGVCRGNKSTNRLAKR